MTVEAPYSSGGGGSFAGAGASGSWDNPTDTAGTTVAGQAGEGATGQETPSRRQYNPLGNYASTTYQLSLYMITPDAYDDFTARERRNIDLAGPETGGKGAYLIAQSGGVNNTSQKRAPGFELDFYIDDLKIKQALDPKATGTSSGTMEVSFTITEPYGFSFISRLKKTASMIATYSSTTGIQDQRNASKQFFVLGIKFLGYNQDGSVAKDTEGMFDKYWDIVFTSVKYKIDGKVTTYSIKAAPLTLQVVMGVKRGLVDLGASPKGITVEDLLIGEDQASGKFGLLTKLNYDQKNTPGILAPNKYSVEFIGPYADQIKNATVRSKADPTSNRPMSDANSTSQVNVKKELTAVPDVNSSQITFKTATPILQAIQQIISQSSYVEDALRTVAVSEPAPNPNTGTPDIVKPKTNKKLRWFNVSSRVSNPVYDTSAKDFAFDITYVVQSYEIPVILVPNANSTTPYYGPIKKYDYWYTGKNSEILRYEQTLDNSYYTVVLGDDGNPETRKNEASISEKRNQRTGVQVQGKIGPGAESYNEVVTQLISPGDFATAKIEILGDPDWLIQPSIGSSSTPYDQFYGPDGFSVNPNAGQVFIEIDFKEAVDYDLNSGVLDINNDILFWDYPDEIKDVIHGISYKVIIVTHSFKGGRFTQELDCVINVFGNKTGSTPSTGDQRTDQVSEANTTSDGATSETNGLLKRFPVSVTSEPIATIDPMGSVITSPIET